MAQDLTYVIPQLLAQGLMALRSRVVMPRLVNRSYENEAREKGDTVDVPIPSAVTANDVVPGADSQAATDISPTKVQIQLSNWKEAAFYLTDKEMAEAVAGILPMQASEAVNALARAVNASVLAQYAGIYGLVGTPGTAPFGGASPSLDDLVAARRVLNTQLAPTSDRRVVLDPVAEAELLQVPGIQDASFRGDTGGITQGQIGTKMGFDIYMDQQIPQFTSGTLTDGSGHKALVDNAAVAVGDTSCDFDETSLTGTVKTGEVFTVAGDSQQYVVTADATAAGNAITLSFSPPVQVAWADDAQMTFAGAASAVYTNNLAFHRDAFALAARPLSDDGLASGRILSQTDPVSGLSLRLEVTREFKRTRWSFDILWGTKLVRAALACRIVG